MKKQVIFMSILLSLSSFSYAQNIIEVSPIEREIVSQELEKEAESPQHNKKTKRLLKKLAKSLRESAKKIEVEVKSLDDCVNCEGKSKGKVLLTNIGRKLGKGSAWLTTKTGKPFMNASAFLTGLFEQQEKNKDIVGLYQFFLNHQDEFDQLYIEAGTPEELIELIMEKVEEIMERKTRIIIKDMLLHLGIKRELPEDLSDFQLTVEEIASIDESKINVDLINFHPEYQEVKPLLGDITKEELMDMVMSGEFNKAVSFENLKEGLPKLHELAGTVVGQVMGPKIALGVISKTLGGLYATPVVAAQIGTGVSAVICSQEETKDKFEEDEDLKAFCSYVVNRSSYELMKSRAKGYVSGKKFRSKLEKKREERKNRREAPRVNPG